jgi:hypothetical protein
MRRLNVVQSSLCITCQLCRRVAPRLALQGSASLASQLAPLVSELGTELAAAVAEEGRSAELRGQWSEASVVEELALGGGQVGAGCGCVVRPALCTGMLLSQLT